jgi:hypothetical protein
MRHSFAAALVLLATTAFLVSCKTEPIRDVSSPVPVGLTANQVGSSVIAGAARRGWLITEKAPGRVVARINVRGRHMAEVEITYDERGYRIAYHDSENLKASKRRIHQNYFRWIANLDQAIRAELIRHSAEPRAVEAPAP